MGDSLRDDGRSEKQHLNYDESVASRGPPHSAISVRTTHSRYERYSRANDDEQTEAAVSVATGAPSGCWKSIKGRMTEFFSDMFGSEFDFGAAYRRAKGLSDGFQSSITTRTEQQDQVRAWDHLKFFPLTFKDSKFETQYSLICSQLFIGRLFLVLIALIFMVIPVLWLLGALCFLDVELNHQSFGAWIAFHASFAANLIIAIVSLILTVFPKLIPAVRKHFELYAYVNVLVWMCIILIVLATFPTLVRAPSQMEMLWTSNAEQIQAVVAKGHPICSYLQTSKEITTFLGCLKTTADPDACVLQCQKNSQCLAEAFQLVIAGVQFCMDMSETVADNYASLGSELDHIWFPFAFYVTYVKATLQVFKIPIVAVAVIVCIFGTGLMFLDSMSPSRTKMTIAMHLLVIPLSSLPFVLLHRTYPTIVPVEETLIYVFSFLFVAFAGWCGRYAQEFQHRLIFCSWRLTTTMLQDLHKKMENQKEAKKSSTAIEELIFQVKECNNIVRMARLRGPRADVTDDLFNIEQLLDKILEMLTASGNLYSVRFTDAAKENDVQRQFIELYNTPDKLRKSNAALSKSGGMATNGSRSVVRQVTAGRMHDAGRTTEASGFGLSVSTSGPVSGLEFSQSLKNSLISGQVDDMSLLFKDMPVPEHTNQLLACVGIDWDYDMIAFSYMTENVLLEVGYALLCRLVGDWGCEDSRLIRFLVAIQGQYLPNPYHNKLHGATVAHLTECLTRMLNAQRTMNSTDKVTLTVAAICHDVGHPGRNNQFFINCYDPLAVIYNDQAVLENFHSCLTFRTLEMKDCNIFANLEDSEFRFIRQNLIACILATDMKQHFESISRFRVRRNSPEFSYSKKTEDRWLVARMCVKVADIGHSSVPWSQHFQWSCRVVEEFYQQGNEETSRGLPISPLCDPEKHADMAKSQNGFLEFVVKPLLKEIEEIEPFSHVKNMVSKHLEYNVSKWQILQESGHPIQLKEMDNDGRTTMTTSAVRKIAGIKRGPPHRTIVHLPAEAPIAQAKANPEQKESKNETLPPAIPVRETQKENMEGPAEGADESFHADFSETQPFPVSVPAEPPTMELLSPGGQ
ncbi:3 5 -cyclic nucleotide phosphodiesterase domain-containing protein [Cyclospora cayetanensis]|uniref:Phosphodiesterase n=1 Tax=Cyclospora cayetanensis TaxID=88456 RepID=A0A1D3CWL0_9EIME|nr:3 5 -cyclic nucleotide phosphodiesterase domain-containing protein [Cyclospora cayetanensis]